MRNLFSWRIRPSEAEFLNLWENATFVFDTNFLLDLYRVSRSTAENFLNILEHIQSRIWLPYQVANEFFNRREEVIDKESASFQKALSEVAKWKIEQQSFSSLRGCLSQSGRIVSTEIAPLFDAQKAYIEVVDEVAKSFKEKIEQIAKEHTSLNSYEDSILEKLLVLFDAKVGEPFQEKELLDLYEEADNRYQQSKAPGFMDARDKKDERKYGDLILWKEILDFAKKTSKPIIFVTGEKKEDWWIKRNGEIISPREDLRREFLEFTQQPFWMYRTKHFLELAEQRLKVAIDPKSIDETIAIAEIDITDDETLRQSVEQTHISGSTMPAIEQIRIPNTKKNVLEQNSSFVTEQDIVKENFSNKINTSPAISILQQASDKIALNLAVSLKQPIDLTELIREKVKISDALVKNHKQISAFLQANEQVRIFTESLKQDSVGQIIREQISEQTRLSADLANSIKQISQFSQANEQVRIFTESLKQDSVGQIIREQINEQARLSTDLAKSLNQLSVLRQQDNEEVRILKQQSLSQLETYKEKPTLEVKEPFIPEKIILQETDR